MSVLLARSNADSQISSRLPEIEKRLDASLARAIPAVSWALAALYAVFGVFHLRTMPGGNGRFMAALAFVSALLLASFALYTWRRALPPEMAHAAASLLAFIVLVNSLAHLHLTGDPRQTTNLMLLVFAAGSLYLNETWFVLTIASTGLMWVSIAFFHGFGSEWTHFGFALFAASVLSWLILSVRRRALSRLELARLQGEWALAQIRESEGRFRDLSGLSSEAVVISEQGTILDVNDRMLEMFARDRTEIVGAKVLDLVAPAHQDFVRQQLINPVEHHYKLMGMRKDGTHFPLEVRARNVVRNARALRVTTIRDLTHDLMVDRMKDEFVSVVSHELRTPLASIRGALGLLSNEKLLQDEVKRQRMVQMALENTARLQQLISDMLDLQRLESGQLTLHREPASALGVVQRVCAEMKDFASTKRVKLRVAGDDAVVFADKDKLVLALSHLINNAVKFSPEEGEVVIACAAEDPAVFSVTDRGRGISQKELPSIFERFRQADSSSTREVGGTGIGLALVRTIVQQHGGRIWAESHSGQGSIFRFTIPVFKDDSHA